MKNGLVQQLDKIVDRFALTIYPYSLGGRLPIDFLYQWTTTRDIEADVYAPAFLRLPPPIEVVHFTKAESRARVWVNPKIADV